MNITARREECEHTTYYLKKLNYSMKFIVFENFSALEVF